MTTSAPARFFRPCLIVQNITTNKSVTVLDLISIDPGETVDLFKVVERYKIPEDQILYGLSIPFGDLYNEVAVKNTLRIIKLDLAGFHYSLVEPSNVVATNAVSDGSIPVADGDGFKWVGVAPPLEIQDDTLSLPAASSSADGYLTKDDWVRFNAAAISGNLVIWQYQDYTAPITSTSLTISDFQNGTGLSFDSSLIVNNSASIVLVSNTEQPPTTTTSFPGRLLPGNRVEVV